MYLYMKVTRDEYELPVAIADSAAELARMVGVKPQTVQACVCGGRMEQGQNCGYFKIEVEDDEDE